MVTTTEKANIIFFHIFLLFYATLVLLFLATDLEDLLEASQDFADDGISVLDRDDGKENWSFGQSVLFTVTVVTTIG